MSFAFQGFGLGEFFKAQQKLTDILDLYFWGIFDAPSAFLLLGHTLGDLSEEIDHLFDENSNPNSAILRSDNRPNIQQILRVASHGVLDVVNELENVLRIPGDNNKQDSSPDLFLALEASGLRPTIIDLNSKFAFQTWKLKLFFRISRKNKIQRYLLILHSAQEALGIILEQHLKQGLSTGRSLQKGISIPTDSPMPRDSFFELYPFDIIQRFQDSCHFEGSTFYWNLKAESTLLVILHWLYMTKLGITESKPLGGISGEAYINLLKTAWLLNVACQGTGTSGFSGELKTLVVILSSEVISIFRDLHDEHDMHWPDPTTLESEGDYTIFTEGEPRRDRFRSFSTGSDTHVLLKPQGGGRTSHDTGWESSALSIKDSQNWRTKGSETVWSRNTREPEYSVSPVLSFGTYSTSSESVSLTISLPEESGPLGTDVETRATTARASSVAVFGSRSPCVGSGFPAYVADVRSHAASAPPASAPRNCNPERHPKFDGFHSRAPKTETRSAIPASSKPEYSWNRKVNTQELSLRPGEIEIMPGELSSINLLLSYTGDLHGRWDSCNIHLFRDAASSTLRILAVKEGVEESFDQQFVSIEETELVPEYGYHRHEPVIYLRGSKDGEKVNYLFFKFYNADDMFNLQSAFLNEAVEADFHAVRALRIKRSNVESYQRAGVQFWREQNTNAANRKSVGSFALNTASTVRSNATVRVHSTRIVIYMYHEKSVVLLFERGGTVTDSIEIEIRVCTRTIRIRSSSRNPFKTPPSIKAKILGAQDVSGGIPLSKLGLAIEDNDNFDDFKWFEFEFGTLEELDSFQQEFRSALNRRRKERRHADDLMRLAAQGVRR